MTDQPHAPADPAPGRQTPAARTPQPGPSGALLAFGPGTSWALVAVAVVSVSASAPVTAASIVPALAIGFWRTALGALVTLPWAWSWLWDRLRTGVRRDGARAVPGLLGGSAASGALLCLHFSLWLPSLRFTSVAAATALVSTPPIWTVAVDRLLGRPTGWRVLVGLGVAMAGIVAITGVDLGHSGRAVLGDLLALGGGMAAAGYMLLGERERRSLPSAVYTAVAYGVAAVLTVPVCLAFGVALAGWPARGWLEIAAVTVFAQLLGHTLLNVAVPVVGATPLALALLLEVPGAALLAWAAYGQPPPLVVLPGAALVLAGLALVVTGRATTPAEEALRVPDPMT